MFNVYIAENDTYTELTDEDFSRIPVIPPVQNDEKQPAQPVSVENIKNIVSNQTVESAPVNTVNSVALEQNNGLLIGIFVVICILVVFLSCIYYNMQKRAQKRKIPKSKRLSELISKQEVKKSGNDISTSTSQISESEGSISQPQTFKADLQDKDMAADYKLGTPGSIEGCIKNFLEITKDK